LTIAVLSDIHGNRWAFEAVLEDLERRGIKTVLHLGDVFFGPLDPGGTAALLRQVGGTDWPTVRGNQDRALGESAAGNATLAFTLGELEEEDRRWAVELPGTAVEGDLFLCHGTPEEDDQYLVEQVNPGGVGLRPEAALAEALGGIDQPLVLCGHSHVPRLASAGSKRVLNPGSVGLPAYTAEAPHPHAMAAGSPEARYALLHPPEKANGGWRVEHVAVPYDHQAAVAAARRHDRPDWAAWLATGRGV